MLTSHRGAFINRLGRGGGRGGFQRREEGPPEHVLGALLSYFVLHVFADCLFIVSFPTYVQTACL
jgi:hypothetical protein